MYEMELVTKDQLELLSHDVLVDVVLRLQQIGLMQDDQITQQKKLISLLDEAITLYDEALNLSKTKSERDSERDND
jgi:hypothetical protein